MSKRLCLWSGPRNVSTALMYSFAQRKDTRVVDEPLYAHYLRVSGLEHPGRAAILAGQENDGQRVVERMLEPWDRPVVFFKQMAHHLVDLDLEFLDEVQSLFLIRNPAEVLVSFAKVIPSPRLEDIGIRRQFELYQDLRSRGQNPVVIDGPELLKGPTVVLKEICRRLEIPFDPAMLSWEAGARPEDGVWAPYWYKRVHRSIGFEPYEAHEFHVPYRLQSVLDASMPYYEALFAQAIKFSTV